MDVQAIAIMPYASDVENMVIGYYDVWNFDETAKIKIPNELFYEQINKLISMYYSTQIVNGRPQQKNISPVKIITPVDYVEKGYTFSSDDFNRIRSVAHILYFSTTSSRNRYNSDMFKIDFYTLNDKSCALNIHGNVITEYQFLRLIQPLSIISYGNRISYGSIISCFSKLLKDSSQQCRSMLRSLELFYNASAVGEMLTIESKILNLLMSIEVLLNTDGKLGLAEKIEKINTGRKIFETRELMIKNVKTKKTFSRTAWWFYDFYQLRNDIIHGNVISWDKVRNGDICLQNDIVGTVIRNCIIKEIICMDNAQSNQEASMFFINDLDIHIDGLISETI